MDLAEEEKKKKMAVTPLKKKEKKEDESKETNGRGKVYKDETPKRNSKKNAQNEKKN